MAIQANQIYISTLAYLGKTPQEIETIALEQNYNIEFSSGLPFMDNMADFFVNCKIKNKLPHNYFPAPKIPFVLNLASANPVIRNKSIEHCIKGIELAKSVNASFFSAHAGFCIDPNPNELGQKIKYKPDFDKDAHWQLFFDSLHQILLNADKNNIDFLIENNVLAPFNRVNDINPLLCCDSSDVKYLFSNIKSSRLHLLLDTAHLKVSCNTLNLDLDAEVLELETYIKAIHHSDNNGLEDTNDQLTNSYWFIPFLEKFRDYVHVLEVKKISNEEIVNNIKILKNE
jgi:sugar phosphate isomerase/epimerase